jgi:hypothetical protein
VLPEPKALRVPQVQTVQMVLQVLPEPRVKKEIKVIKGTKVTREILD